MARIEGYAYSDGTSKFRAVNSLVVEEQPSSPATTTARLAAPAVFSAALDLWRAILDATTPDGLYAISYSATTRRVTIASTNLTPFRPVWQSVDRALALWLGFDPDAAYAFALTHTGTAVPYGCASPLAVEVEPPEDAAKPEIQQVRLGRAFAPVFGNHLLQRVTIVGKVALLPSSWAWLTTGRVRVYPTATATEYSATNLDGYYDGHVVEHNGWERLGDDEGLDVLTLTLALPRG